MIKAICALALAAAFSTLALAADYERPRGDGGRKLGVVTVTVVDEDDEVIPDVDVLLNGKPVNSTLFSHRAGKVKSPREAK